MSDYALLRQGDRLPTVGVLQVLLNRSGASLKIDGDFGPRTRDALIEFQYNRRLQPDGSADGTTWQRLMFKDTLPLVDVIDVFDESVLYKAKYLIDETGSQPVMLGGMSNGLQQMGLELATQRNIFLLRIIGHGCAGTQAISMGKGGWIEAQPHGKKPLIHFYPHATTSMKLTTIGAFPAKVVKRTFGLYASVELHGCHVAAGKTGHRFLTALANLLGVPVSAGIGSQRSALRFDGTTFTAVPHGRTLAQWCSKLPMLSAITVP